MISVLYNMGINLKKDTQALMCFKKLYSVAFQFSKKYDFLYFI